MWYDCIIINHISIIRVKPDRQLNNNNDEDQLQEEQQHGIDDNDDERHT